MLDNWHTSQKIRQILQISPQCLYEMKKHGRIEFKKVSSKKYLFKLPEDFEQPQEKAIAIYARVSTPKQKKDLQNQVMYLRKYIVANGNAVNDDFVFTDIASGMNEKRKGLNDLMTAIISGQVSKVIISNRDRLTRFGYGYLKSIFDKYNCEIIEVNLTEDKTFEQELTDDLITIIHHFSMKFYGKRKNKLKKFEDDMRNCEESK